MLSITLKIQITNNRHRDKKKLFPSSKVINPTRLWLSKKNSATNISCLCPFNKPVWNLTYCTMYVHVQLKNTRRWERCTLNTWYLPYNFLFTIQRTYSLGWNCYISVLPFFLLSWHFNFVCTFSSCKFVEKIFNLGGGQCFFSSNFPHVVFSHFRGKTQKMPPIVILSAE